MFTQTGSFKGNPSPLLSTHAEGQNSRLLLPSERAWSAPSNISLTFRGRCLEIKKATENIGFQIARLANRLRSATNWFENCPARATNAIGRASTFGGGLVVSSGARRACS